MRKLLWLLAVLTLWAIHVSAQTNAPIRLALIAPEAALRPAMDLLTAELSRQNQIALLERVEIDRVFREQSLSAANQDFLKLGQVLGADGLLIGTMIKEGTQEFLDVRLVAVKPGVGQTAAFPAAGKSCGFFKGFAALNCQNN